FETYRTIYRDRILPINVAELLILDRRMPRSLAACLDQIHQALSRVQGQNDHPAKRLAAELQARLVHGDIEGIFSDGLHEHLVESCSAREGGVAATQLSPIVFLRPAALSRAEGALGGFAERCRRCASSRCGLTDLGCAILDKLPFQPGVTGVHSTAAEAFDAA